MPAMGQKLNKAIHLGLWEKEVNESRPQDVILNKLIPQKEGLLTVQFLRAPRSRGVNSLLKSPVSWGCEFLGWVS